MLVSAVSHADACFVRSRGQVGSPWNAAAAVARLCRMDTVDPASNDSADPGRPETEAEKRLRFAREASMIAEARAELDAGLYVDAWIDSIGTDHELPAPPRQAPLIGGCVPRTLTDAPVARDDLIAIRSRLTQASSGPAARRRLRAIRTAINRPREDSCRYPVGEHPGVRERPCSGGYGALYKVRPDTGRDDTAGHVRVLRVFGPGQSRGHV
jgi:plasmid stabilization system protein ParE